jgi:hypothetical protein
MVTGLQSARLKILRASKHIEEIKSCIATYTAGNPYEVIPQPDGKEILTTGTPPPELSVIAGEVLYQLRSALDHLAFDLVKLNPGNISLPADWTDKCEFPLFQTLKPGQQTPLPYGSFTKLPGVSKEAHAVIEALQPYYRVGAANNYLRVLTNLSNIDKHRHLTLMRTRAVLHEKRVMSSGLRGTSFASLDHGAEIPALDYFSFGSDTTVDLDRSFTRAVVTFNEKEALGGATSLPVDYLLGGILDQILRFIVPAVEKLLKNP